MRGGSIQTSGTVARRNGSSRSIAKPTAGRIYNSVRMSHCRKGRPIDQGTLRRLLNDPLIFVLPKRKGRAPKNGTVSVASVAVDAVRTFAKGKARPIGTPLTRAMRSLFLDYEVRADLVNGYSAFVWENGMHIFFTNSTGFC